MLTEPPPPPQLKRLSDFSLSDLESMRLVLQGDSVIDWQQMFFRSHEGAETFLRSLCFEPDQADDRLRLEAIQHAAVDFLRRQFDFPIPRPLEEGSLEDLLLTASGRGHRQLCACTILKAMHIIHHVEARELLFSLALSHQELFRLVEERVFQLVGQMLSAGLPITEFVGGRKRRDSIYSKLLSKREAHASAIYDKLRFRIVTRTKDDILPLLQHLSQHLFAFNYVVPGESTNTIFPFRRYCEAHPHLKQLLPQLPPLEDDTLHPGDNQFSADNYRIIHFVVDMPLRVPEKLLQQCTPEALELGPILFALCEFQIVDQETEKTNELGDASHSQYKARQHAAVMERLKLGNRARRGKATKA